ncbi:MAG: SDR family NAD(P)-dependent oxidoreductase [Chloroflexota bacterium]|nr:SDR family NAD(P)-dependent oxidoreductase [Chloroflexota bacterium]
MELNLKDKVALVTGAGRHIGREIALTLAREGTTVVVNDYFADRADKVAEEIKASGGEAIGLRADVRDEDEVRAMVKQSLDRFGKIDILVNNAGVLPEGVGESAGPFFSETKSENWQDNVGVNLFGVLNCTRAVINQMIERKYGKIVNTVSDAGRVGEPGMTAYSAAKAGIVGFTKALAKEVGRYCINVNCVSLGSTPQTGTITEVPEEKKKAYFRLYPMARGWNRLGLPSDAANAVAFFASDTSVWVTGQVLSVSGGYSTVD